MHCHSFNKCFTALSLTFKRSSSAFLSGCCFGLTGKTITPELNALSRTVQTGPASRQPILNSPMDLPSISTPTNCIGAMQGLMWLVGWTLTGRQRRFSIDLCRIRLDWMSIMRSSTGPIGGRLASFRAPRMVEGKLCWRRRQSTCMVCVYILKKTKQVLICCENMVATDITFKISRLFPDKNTFSSTK